MPTIMYKLSVDSLAAQWRREFETTEQRAQFIDEHTPPIYWYYFPEDDAWKKGPAWNPPKPDKVESIDDQGEDDRW